MVRETVLPRRLSIAVVLLSLIIWAGIAAANGEVAPKGSLSGTVLDPDGKPVSGARIWIEGWNGKANVAEAEARSDVSGHFRLGPVEASYRHRRPILIEAKGFARQYIARASYSIFPGTDCDLGKIQVYQGRVFTGQVLDVDGQPCRDVEVTCEARVFELGHTVVEIMTQHLRTDSQGRFRTGQMPVGNFGVSTAPHGRKTKWVTRPVQPGGQEALEPLRLEPDAPIHGLVTDSQGKPVAGAEIHASGYETSSGSDGRFAVRGFGPNPSFQFVLDKDGFSLINWGVKMREDGIHYHEVGGSQSEREHVLEDFTIVLPPQAWIEGRAFDAETGKPVKLERIVLCECVRKPSGEVETSGCGSPQFDQPGPGVFRVPYSRPAEYHLTLLADGYHDGEAFTPKLSELAPVPGLLVKMRRNNTAPVATKQAIAGVVTRNGKPVRNGWVGLWKLRRPIDIVNAFLLRGRTVVGPPAAYESAPLRDGKYMLNVPFQSDAWYVVVEEPGQPITQVGPIAVRLNENKNLDIVCTEGGRIAGRVKSVPAEWKGHYWVVAFSKTAVREQARIGVEGNFSLPSLPPGRYGLKVGHDAYEDPDIPHGDTHPLPRESWSIMADPWKRAKVVTVKAGETIGGVELELPAPDLSSGGHQ